MRLLIIGNLDGQIAAASKIASSKGASVVQHSDIESALKAVRSGRGADLIMIDVNFDVAGLIKNLASQRISVPVVGYGIQSNSQLAVAAIKAGAREYIPLPPDEEMIAAVLETVTNEQDEIIYKSFAMKRIVELADKVARSAAGILITGESGTGKEVIAKYIHKKSDRSGKQMICVNCAAIPDNLLESELFGHEKGAFTGAVAKRIGKFEEANGSTLLLDEISEMDIRLQAKLLRALQERVIDRVGGTSPVKVDIRVIATSNRDLREEVKKGNFREDLYFRLNVINLELPPLRKRTGDTEFFVKHFIKKFSELNHLQVKEISPAAMLKLNNYSWPGNVREIENTIHRAVLISSANQIEESDIILTGEPDNDNESLAPNVENMVGRTVSSVEKSLIINTLDHCLGNRTQAANILGISIRTLRNKLNDYKEEAS